MRWKQPVFTALMAIVALWHLSAYGQDGAPKAFGAPEEGVAQLVGALAEDDIGEVLEVLGTGAKDVITSGDEVADKSARERFLTLYREMHRLDRTDNGEKAFLLVGAGDWPFPIPLVKVDAFWRFDTGAGKEEIINRRIGRNELEVIGLCRTYVEAQREFASRDWDNDGVIEYAGKIVSDKGRWNGLYWEALEDEIRSPLGPLFAEAAKEGYGTKKADRGPSPFHGYLFRILTGQGPHAAGGAHRYTINGRMVAGFGLVAYPAEYGSSGIMTFIVNQDGRVYQRDLGKKTASAAARMKVFDPDKTWRRIEDTE